jgi:predicted adenylyl cyclase CyaB
MKEIEIKFRVKDFTEVRSRLKKLGAVLEWKGVEQSWFYDTPRQDLRAKGYNLRLRAWDGHSYMLTLKTKPRQEDGRYKIRNEHEMQISSLDTAFKILKLLGYGERIKYRKFREHWKLRGASVELDTLKGMHFVEIEAGKRRIDELALALGLDWKQTVRKGYISILQETEKESR